MRTQKNPSLKALVLSACLRRSARCGWRGRDRDGRSSMDTEKRTFSSLAYRRRFRPGRHHVRHPPGSREIEHPRARLRSVTRRAPRPASSDHVERAPKSGAHDSARISNRD
jgi:hypothetical protein